jgi:hypothetical protein
MTPTPLAGPDYIFEEIVLPNYRDWLVNLLSIRHAYNAAVSIAHMADHIAVRSNPPRTPAAVRKDFTGRCETFAVVDAMCNAIKHVYATGSRNGPNHVMATATGMTTADPKQVLFVAEVDGAAREHRPANPFLVFDIHNDRGKRQAWVPWMLYGALYFVAHEMGCGGLVFDSDRPPQTNLFYRVLPFTGPGGGFPPGNTP